jgi:hypothetical protein
MSGSDLLKLAADAVLWVLGGFAGLLGIAAKDYKSTRTLARENNDMLTGDDDNPHYDGLIEVAEDNNKRIRGLENNMQDLREDVQDIHRAIKDDDAD